MTATAYATYGSAQPALTIEKIESGKPHNATGIDCTPNNDEYKLIWISKGIITIDNHPPIVLKNQSVLYLSGKDNNRLRMDGICQGYIISFTTSAIPAGDTDFIFCCSQSATHLFASGQYMAVQDESLEDMEHLLTLMLHEQQKTTVFRTELLGQYLKLFLLHLNRQLGDLLRPRCPARNRTLVSQFMDAVEKNFRVNKTVSHYAGLLYVTPNYLNEVVKKVTGLPAGHHIRFRVVSEAKRIAASSNDSMKEIAYYLGFDDTAHFSKFFKSVEGQNFSSFKKTQEMMTVTTSRRLWR